MSVSIRRIRAVNHDGSPILRADEITCRDTTMRQYRVKHPLERMNTAPVIEHGYALHQIVTYTEGQPITATLDGDGRPMFSEGFMRGIGGHTTQPDRDYLTIAEIAALLDLSEERIGVLAKQGTIPVYRPGGGFGRKRVLITRFLAYAEHNGYTAEQLKDLQTRITTITTETP